MLLRRQTSRTPSPPPPPPSAAPVVMVAGGPPATRTLSRKGSSNDSFVCNVSDDEVIERDVDMEIEARIRSGTLPTSDRGTVLDTQPVAQRPQRVDSAVTSHAPVKRSSKSTLSQRMLSALQRNKNRSNNANATRSKRSGSVLLEVVQAENGMIPENSHEMSYAMGADLDGLVVPDPLYDPSQDPVYMSDDENPAMVVANATSCKDRLEARLSERRLNNKSSLSGRPDSLSAAPVDVNEMSAVVYSNRRTYPAESAKTVDPRFSEDRDRVHDARMRPAPIEQRAPAGGYQYQYQHQYTANTVETLDASKSLPVAFHFQGNRAPQAPASPVDYRNHRHNNQPMHDARQDFSYQSRARESAPRRNDQYTMLASSVDQIEQVVDGLENCLMSSAFSSLASVALRELELLRESTKQVRMNGTTLILAEVGRPQSQMLRPFRHLVSRAATLQSRIEILIARIRAML